MPELPIKQKSQKVKITLGKHKEEVQVLVDFHYSLDIYHQYKHLDGSNKHANKGWWPKGELMTEQLCDNRRVSFSIRQFRKAKINPISKNGNDLPSKTPFKSIAWILGIYSRQNFPII